MTPRIGCPGPRTLNCTIFWLAAGGEGWSISDLRLGASVSSGCDGVSGGASERESGNSGLELKFDNFNITSSLSTLGLMGSIAFGTRFGVLVPQASFDWKHQFDLDQQKLDVSFIDDLRSKKFSYQSEEPDRDYYEINAGLVFVMPNGLQAFGNYRTITSNSLYDSDAYTLGLRYSF